MWYCNVGWTAGGSTIIFGLATRSLVGRSRFWDITAWVRSPLRALFRGLLPRPPNLPPDYFVYFYFTIRVRGGARAPARSGKSGNLSEIQYVYEVRDFRTRKCGPKVKNWENNFWTK